MFITKPERKGHRALVLKITEERDLSVLLLSLKRVERLMDRYLKNNAVFIRPLNQYAYEEEYAYVRSTDTTLHHLVSEI